MWLVLAVYALVAFRRPAAAWHAAVLGVDTFVGLLTTFVLVFAFVGLFHVWVSEEFVMRHLGEASGVRGPALGALLGTVLHGPLVGVFPLLKSLLAKRARLGVVIAIVSTWAIKVPMIPLEVSLFGWRFTLVREGLLFASAFVMAPLMELALGRQWVDRYRARLESDALSPEASGLQA